MKLKNWLPTLFLVGTAGLSLFSTGCGQADRDPGPSSAAKPAVSEQSLEDLDSQLRAEAEKRLGSSLDSCDGGTGYASGCYYWYITCDDGHGCYADCGTELYCY